MPNILNKILDQIQSNVENDRNQYQECFNPKLYLNQNTGGIARLLFIKIPDSLQSTEKSANFVEILTQKLFEINGPLEYSKEVHEILDYLLFHPKTQKVLEKLSNDLQKSSTVGFIYILPKTNSGVDNFQLVFTVNLHSDIEGQVKPLSETEIWKVELTNDYLNSPDEKI